MSEHYETSWFCDKLCSHRRNIDSALIAANARIAELQSALSYHNDDYVKQVGTWKIVQRLEEQVDELRSDRDKFFDMYHELSKQFSELEKERDSLSGDLLALQDVLKVFKTRDVVRLLNENEKLKSSLIEFNNKLEIEASQLNGNPYAPPMKVYKENE